MQLQEYLAQPWLLQSPTYTIHRYTDQIYKIVHFKRPRSFVERSYSVDRSTKDNEEKLSQAVSRAKRVILELALCNRWDYFCTFTLDKDKYNRYDLHKWYKDFSQWIRDQRKKHGCMIRYILIPELHEDGAWHIHGLMVDLPEDLVSFSELRYIRGWKVPNDLVKANYKCWLSYHNKFGFCSLGDLKKPVAAGFYVTKYVAKSLDKSPLAVGQHLYYASHGLLRSTVQTHIFGENAYFNHWLTNKYEFVDTGMTFEKDGLGWDFALEFAPDSLVPLDQAYVGELGLVEQEFMDNMMEGVQLVIDQWGALHIPDRHHWN